MYFRIVAILFTRLIKKIYSYGFKHTDITDKSDAIQKANRRSTSTLSLTFKFNDKQPNIRHVSVCAVIEKSTDELASQLYLQTSSLYIGRAMEKSSRNIPVAQQVQQTAVKVLSQYDLNDKLQLQKTETLFLSCAQAFITEWNGKYTKQHFCTDIDSSLKRCRA